MWKKLCTAWVERLHALSGGTILQALHLGQGGLHGRTAASREPGRSKSNASPQIRPSAHPKITPRGRLQMAQWWSRILQRGRSGRIHLPRSSRGRTPLLPRSCQAGCSGENETWLMIEHRCGLPFARLERSSHSVLQDGPCYSLALELKRRGVPFLILSAALRDDVSRRSFPTYQGSASLCRSTSLFLRRKPCSSLRTFPPRRTSMCLRRFR